MSESPRRPSDGYAARLRAPVALTYVRHYRGHVSAAVMSLVVVAICTLVVRNGDVGATERSVFNTINGLPDSLKAPMWALQLSGTLTIVAVVAVAAVAIHRFRLGLALAATIPLKLAIEWWGVKALVERERPFYTVPDAVIREVSTSSLGYPSGHAIFAFALAGLVAPYLDRRGRIVVYMLAVLAGIARVYLGAHNPLDVVAGAALGIVVAAGLNLAAGTPQSPK